MRKMTMVFFALIVVLVVTACSSVNEAEPTATPAVTPAATENSEDASTNDTEQASADVTTEYEILLVDAGTEKLEVVKAIRDNTSLDLAGSKDIVDGAPASVASKLTKDEADKLVAAIQAAGATVEIKETEVSSNVGADGEQLEFEVVLIDPGTGKLNVVKAIRDNTSLDLAGSKEIVDGAPATVIKGISKDEADKLKTELEAVGATVEVK